MEETAIDQVTEDRSAHYEPFGWHHWPEHPWMSYQFRRALGETSEGGGTVSECFRAASRMIPGDKESWHREWMAIADFNHRRGDDELGLGHVQTAKNCWLRAADYYRQAEFWLAPHDPRRLATGEVGGAPVEEDRDRLVRGQELELLENRQAIDPLRAADA